MEIKLYNLGWCSIYDFYFYYHIIKLKIVLKKLIKTSRVHELDYVFEEYLYQSNYSLNIPKINKLRALNSFEKQIFCD